MKGSRNIIIAFSVFLVITGVGLFFLWQNIDYLVRAAIEKYGSQATKTAVRVSSVGIKLSSGEASISGLTVANPSGFSSPYVFRLGKISTKINARTVASKRIIIDNIIVSAPQVTYEMNKSGASNINALKKNIQQSTPGTAKKAEKKKGEERKFVIRKLVIEEGRIDVHIAAVGDKPGTLKMGRIELTDIGKGTGATPKQIAEQVVTAIVEEVSISVAKAGIERGINTGIDEAVKKLFGN